VLRIINADRTNFSAVWLVFVLSRLQVRDEVDLLKERLRIGEEMLDMWIQDHRRRRATRAEPLFQIPVTVFHDMDTFLPPLAHTLSPRG